MRKAFTLITVFFIALLPLADGAFAAPAPKLTVSEAVSTPQPSSTFFQPTSAPKPTLTPMAIRTPAPAMTLTPVTPSPKPTPVPTPATLTSLTPTSSPVPQRTPIANVTRILTSDELIFARELSELINSKRTLAGLDPFTLDVALCLPAKQRAVEALSFTGNGDVPNDVHVRPNGEYYNTVMYDYGFTFADYRFLIEALSHNIMYSDETLPAADRFMRELMQPEILNNIILNDSFSVLGVGVAYTRERVRYGDDVFYSGCAFVCVFITSGYDARTPYYVSSYPQPVFAPGWNYYLSSE